MAVAAKALLVSTQQSLRHDAGKVPFTANRCYVPDRSHDMWNGSEGQVREQVGHSAPEDRDETVGLRIAKRSIS